jgi:hypothetical protein
MTRALPAVRGHEDSRLVARYWSWLVASVKFPLFVSFMSLAEPSPIRLLAKAGPAGGCLAEFVACLPPQSSD